MKKHVLIFIIFLTGLMSSQTLFAQNQYYFHEGDTIRGRDTIYHYDWWTDQWLSDSSHKLATDPYYGFLTLAAANAFSSGIHGKMLRYCYTEQPLTVVGVATTLYPWYSSFYNALDISPLFQEYVLLYEADTSRQIREVARAPFVYPKTPRYMDVDERLSPDPCCRNLYDGHQIAKIREYYFDKPVTVYDSFYVGHTTISNWWPNPELDSAWTIVSGVNVWATGYVIYADYQGICAEEEYQCEFTPQFQYLAKQDDFETLLRDSLWHYYSSNYLALEFPIIQIDSFYVGLPQYECPPVSNFRVGDILPDNNAVVLLWDSHPEQQMWQVSYGPSGTPPDSGTIVYCPMQVRTIPFLDTCTDYVFYIRALCHHDSTVYSEWSDSVVVNICDTTHTEPIGIGSSLAQFVHLYPNPASSHVQVFSSFEIAGIEVYDLNGQQHLRASCSGYTTALSVERWTPGIYFAVVHTAVGNYTKKFVVR